MPKRGNEMREVLKDELTAAGVPAYTCEPTGGGHQKIGFVLGGKWRTLFFPSTPGDRRALMNARTFARRKLREWGAPAA